MSGIENTGNQSARRLELQTVAEVDHPLAEHPLAAGNRETGPRTLYQGERGRAESMPDSPMTRHEKRRDSEVNTDTNIQRARAQGRRGGASLQGGQAPIKDQAGAYDSALKGKTRRKTDKWFQNTTPGQKFTQETGLKIFDEQTNADGRLVKKHIKEIRNTKMNVSHAVASAVDGGATLGRGVAMLVTVGASEASGIGPAVGASTKGMKAALKATDAVLYERASKGRQSVLGRGVALAKVRGLEAAKNGTSAIAAAAPGLGVYEKAAVQGGKLAMQHMAINTAKADFVQRCEATENLRAFTEQAFETRENWDDVETRPRSQ